MRHRHRGFTLVESLVVLMILGLIGVAIMGFFPFAARLFQRGGAEATAENAASRCIEKMAPLVREAMDMNVVTVSGSQIRLEITLPLKQFDATTNENLVAYPLTVGKRMAFYRSNSAGNPSVLGNFFWRAENIGGSWQPVEKLTEGITSFTAPTINITLPPKGCEVVVVARVKQGSRTATITHREYLQCRNSR